MEENRIEKQPQQPVTVMMVPQPVDEDEINLLDLWRTLMRGKRIVLAVAGLAVVAGLAYALLAPPVYRAEAFLLPPADKDVQGLNVQGLNVQGLNVQGLNVQITPEKVYQIAIRNLRSRSLRRRFFDMNGLEGVDEAFKVEQDKKRKSFVAIAFEGRDAGLAAQWVNDFLGLVQKETVNTLVGDIRGRIENAKGDLRESIAAMRQMAENRRLDEVHRLTEKDKVEREEITKEIISLRQKEIKKISDKIEMLKEAIRIASSLGIVDAIAMLGQSDGKATINASPAINVNIKDQPLYYRGKKALESEGREMELRRKHLDAFIPGLRELQEKLALLQVNSRAEVLKQRKNDDPFIEGLRDLQERLAKLNGIELNPASIKAFSLDQAAIPPKHRIRPRRTLIVLLALFGGLMLGVFAAFFTEFLTKIRREQTEILASE